MVCQSYARDHCAGAPRPLSGSGGSGNACVRSGTHLLRCASQQLALTARSLHYGDSVRFLRYLLRGEGSMRTPAFDPLLSFPMNARCKTCRLRLVSNHREHRMEPLIRDSTSDARMSGLERFLQRYLGPRRPEFGASADEVRSIEMPAQLQRFFSFAGRWPGHNPQSPLCEPILHAGHAVCDC